MPKRGKNYKEAVQAYDKAELYDVDPAMEIVTKTAKAKFDETVEVHVRLGVDGRHADQQVRGAIVLPHGTGKTKMPDLNAADLDAATEMIKGTARSMGIVIED